MPLVLVGLSHHTAPLEVRERIGISRSMLPAALDRLASEGCDDAVLLSTCNRTEVYAIAADPAAMGERIVACLSDYRGTCSGSPPAWTRWSSASPRSSAR